MNGVGLVIASAAAFVGTHFLLSHPWRSPLVRAAGERGFLLIYSVVAFATLGAVVWSFGRAETTAPLWDVGDGIWAVVTVLMLVAAVLLMGSVVRNPAMPNPTGNKPGGAPVTPGEARGVFAVTRHPMMWAFAIWGVCHVLVYPVAKNIAVAVSIVVLALAGAALQDRKKAALDPGGWGGWQARTSYWPFAAVAAGRARLSGLGLHALAGGAVVWLAATWLHIPAAGWRAGIWRWIGG